MSRISLTRNKPRKRRTARNKEMDKKEEARLRLEKELKERSARESVLTTVTRLFKRAKNKQMKELQKSEDLKEWERYTNCNRMPYPEKPTSVRQHFLVWSRTSKYATLDEISLELLLYIPIFDLIHYISDLPLKPYTRVADFLRETMEEWKTAFNEHIDYACFVLIKDIWKYFQHIDFYTRNFERTFLDFGIGMWALMNVPMRTNQLRDLPSVEFLNIGMTVSLPLPYDLKPIVLRGMYTRFDFYSDSTRSRFQREYAYGDLLDEVKRCMAVKDVIDEELKEIEKLKEKHAEEIDSTKAITSPDSTSSYTSRISRISTVDHRMSTRSMSGKTERSESPSTGSIFSTYSKRRTSFGRSKLFEERKQYPWERQTLGDQFQQRMSISTFTGKSMIHSNVLTLDSSMDFEPNEKSEELNKIFFERWSFNDLDLLNWKEPDIEVEKSLTFSDLLFCSEDKRNWAFLKECKNVRELIKEYEKNNDDTAVSAAVKSFYEREDGRYNKFVQDMTLDLEPHEVNLRQYHSFSGIYHVDLIAHSQDLCKLQIGDCVQVQFGPYQLEYEHFLYEKEPETIKNEFYLDEIEIKEEEEVEEEEESKEVMKDENLVCVEIDLRPDVFWMMRPQPAVWDKEKKIWSTQHVYEVNHDRQKYKIQFKLGKVGPVAFFTLRFHELPFKNWTLTPIENDDGINLMLFGQNLNLEFTIGAKEVCLRKIEGNSSSLFNPLIDKMMCVYDLVDAMRSLGLDVFPEQDTFLYVDVQPKPLALEDHVYFSMAMFAKIVEYSSSSWNFSLGRNEISFRCRLFTPNTPIAFRTFKANNFRCDMLMIEDDANQYFDNVNKEVGFFPDAYSLLNKFYGKNVYLDQSDLPKVNNVYLLLSKTKVLTYSGVAKKTKNEKPQKRVASQTYEPKEVQFSSPSRL